MLADFNLISPSKLFIIFTLPSKVILIYWSSSLIKVSHTHAFCPEKRQGNDNPEKGYSNLQGNQLKSIATFLIIRREHHFDTVCCSSLENQEIYEQTKQSYWNFHTIMWDVIHTSIVHTKFIKNLQVN